MHGLPPTPLPCGAVQMGDLIYLEAHITEKSGAQRFGLLHAEGQVLTRVGLRANLGAGQGRVTDRFSECVFRVCPRLKYEASSTIVAQRDAKKNPSASNASSLRKEMFNLVREAGQERESNAKTTAAMEENPTAVLFGSTIQLQHVRSGAFLTARNEQAELNKAALKLEVGVCRGSSLACQRNTHSHTQKSNTNNSPWTLIVKPVTNR